MKYENHLSRPQPRESLPSRGAWIEIICKAESLIFEYRSLPSRGAWIEIGDGDQPAAYHKSLPSRGAWIEILSDRLKAGDSLVAPLTGSVD